MGSIQESQTFRPSRWKFWAPFVGGLFILLVALVFLVLPILVTVAKPISPWVVAVVVACGGVMLLLGIWTLRHALRLRGAMVRIENDYLELNLQQWAVWKRKRLHFVRLRWNEIRSVRLCTIDNFVLPGGVDENYILATPQGEFVVQTTLWDARAKQIAELIAHRIQQPIQQPSDVPEAVSRLSPADERRVKLVRAFGWVCTIVACLLVGLLLIALPTVNAHERWELGKAIFFSLFALGGANSLRRFKVRMG